MKEIGAKAVLAKRRGKFITNIRAINSICPGKTNAKHKLIDVTKRTNRISVVKTIPKPMVKIGPYPIIIHIIKHYIKYGFNDFILATGYKSYVFKKYFFFILGPPN